MGSNRSGGENPLRLHAAGSLKAALSEVSRAFSDRYAMEIEATFGAAGLLRGRIEAGEPADVFASANMEHPQHLARAGKGGPAVPFARNRLCVLARPEVEITTATVLDVLLDPAIRLGTSTPKADPSGDYAWAMFRRAEALRPGSYAALSAKARRLTGGPDSAKAPAGRSTYGWVMENRQADVFLTYRTTAATAAAEVTGLQVVPLPEALAVGAEYGLLVTNEARPAAWKLAMFILSPDGQRVLSEHGFAVPAPPQPPLEASP